MRNLVCLMLLATLAPLAKAEAPAVREHWVCEAARPVTGVPVQYDLLIESDGSVSGTYSESFAEGAKLTRATRDLQDRDNQHDGWVWRYWSHPSVSRAEIREASRSLEITVNGSMGGDEDRYSLKLDAKSRSATVAHRFFSDCGDGKWHSGPSARFSCRVGAF